MAPPGPKPPAPPAALRAQSLRPLRPRSHQCGLETLSALHSRVPQHLLGQGRSVFQHENSKAPIFELKDRESLRFGGVWLKDSRSPLDPAGHQRPRFHQSAIAKHLSAPWGRSVFQQENSKAMIFERPPPSLLQTPIPPRPRSEPTTPFSPERNP